MVHSAIVQSAIVKSAIVHSATVQSATVQSATVQSAIAFHSCLMVVGFGDSSPESCGLSALEKVSLLVINGKGGYWLSSATMTTQIQFSMGCSR